MREKMKKWLAGILIMILVVELVPSDLATSLGMQVFAASETGALRTEEQKEETLEERAILGTLEEIVQDQALQELSERQNEEIVVQETVENEIKERSEINVINDPLVWNTLEQQMEIRPLSADMGTATIPDTLEALAKDEDKTFLISSYQDWINLQKLSKLSNLEGYTFQITVRSVEGGSNNSYYLTDIADFTGLGSETTPFAGTLTTIYATGVAIVTAKPLFQYLSSNAKISKLTIYSSAGTCAGVAQHLLVEGNTFGTFSEIRVQGDIINGNLAQSGVAGGLFANVINTTGNVFELKGTNVAVSSSVTGKVAGGLVGNLTGKVNLVLDGGITWSPYTVATTTDATPAVSGGLVGAVGAEGVVTELTVTGSASNSITFTEADNKAAHNYMTQPLADMGGLFGCITNATVNLNSGIVYNGTAGEGADLCAMNVGTFAGRISSSTINLNAPFTVNRVRIYQRPVDGTASGIGGFAGSITGSTINAASSTAPITLNNVNVSYVGSGTVPTYNIGGFIGYVKNSKLLLSEASYCKITNFSSTNTNGNVAGGIGYYEADSTMNGAIIGYIGLEGVTKVYANAGNAAGLIACMSLSDCNITLQQSYVWHTWGHYDDAFCYTAAENVSMGIAYVTGNSSAASLTLKSTAIRGTFARMGGSNVKVLGGLVGTTDVDLNILGTIDESGRFDIAVGANYFHHQYPTYQAGLIGCVSQSGNNNRKVNITNVLVGNLEYNGYSHPVNYGGIIAKVEEKTSVCFDGQIHMRGGKAAILANGMTYTVNALNPEMPTRYFGAIVGEQNYSLLFTQPKAEVVRSTMFSCDDVGNYGGIFHNGNWDGEIGEDGLPTDNSNPSTWLIQNHEVTGTWEAVGWKTQDNGGNYYPVLKMDTVGDWMRLAIFGNTVDMIGTHEICSGFYPLTIKKMDGTEIAERNTVCFLLVLADVQIVSGTYDLTKTGIVSLYRNVENSVAINSLLGIEKNGVNPTVKYKAIVYNQTHVGLFPTMLETLSEKKTNITCENLNIEYDICLEKSKYYNNSKVSYLGTSAQFVGGLAATGSGNITLSNVSYRGTVRDNKQSTNPSYIGGLIGVYSRLDGKTATLDSITSDVDITYSRASGIVGGVIALVNGPDTVKATINASDIVIQGTITATNIPKNNVLLQSGFITQIYSGNTPEDGIQTILNLHNISVNDFKMTTADTSVEYYATGGFLGLTWSCCDVTLEGVQVGTSGSAEISAKSALGGLIYKVRGKMSITDMTYGAKTLFNVYGKKFVCGLLVADGANLYLNLGEYKIEDGLQVLNYADTRFDEIVGTIKTSVSGIFEVRTGIVSINTGTDPNLGKPNATAYTSYCYVMNWDDSGNGIATNTKVDVKKTKRNALTRYYYDLDQLDYSVDYSVLDSPQKVMVWHIMHQASEYIVKYCLEDPEGNDLLKTMDSIPTAYTIRNAIDMTGYSIYPSNLLQGENYNAEPDASIKFNAKEINAGERTLKNNSNELIVLPAQAGGQHYRMHAGLFGDVYAGISVDGLTLTGTYSDTLTTNADKANFRTSGALVAGHIYGVPLEEKGEQGQTLYDDSIKNIFTNITLQDLWCNDRTLKTAVVDVPTGLMIAEISSGAQVTIDGVIMTGYGSVDGKPANPGAEYKAANALIGSVGDSKATYISLRFSNIDIADAAPQKGTAELNSSVQEEALGYASLIYQYNYSENCSAIYTFESTDYENGKLSASPTAKVTLGQELGNQDYEGTQYAEIQYNDVEKPIGKAVNVDSSMEIPFDCNNYIPYVYTGDKDILVNPKVASIEEGCGTYEDPYIISTGLQLVSIYRYLHDEETYKEVFEMQDGDGKKWSMHTVGNGKDDSQCDKTETSHGSLWEYGSASFPTKEALSQAYYQIANDIDISNYPEFIGFGREEQPFIGVIVGKKQNDSSYPTITLSKQGANSKLQQYALIHTAKGAVVKDLILKLPSPVIVGGENGGIGAGVMAKVVGGENIIDNVKVVSNNDDTACFSPVDAKSVIGGFVGVVDLGAVILCNMSGNTLKDSDIIYPFLETIDEATGEVISEATTIDDYPYIGSMVGNVLDGYVVYDGTENPELAILEKDSSAQLPLCNTYDIISGAYLNTMSSKIRWNNTVENTYKIVDNKQLQVMSMALNSGMLNYNNGTDTGVGYNAASRQRNGNYDYVGNVGSTESNAAYNDVRTNDNCSTFSGKYDSYLCQYFDLQTDMLNADDSASIMNPTLKTTNSEPLTYRLAGGEYDMSVFKKGFRGFGARYHGLEYTSNNSHHTKVVEPTLLFQSHFKGTDSEHPAKIILDMHVTKEMNATRVGLLNEIPDTTEGTELEIRYITLSGNVVNEGFDYSLKTLENDAYWYSNKDYNAGGIASETITKLQFAYISLNNLTVDATGNAGGIIGLVKENVQTDLDCQITSIENLTVNAGYEMEEGVLGGYAGGLIGQMKVGGQNGSKLEVGSDSFEGVRGNNVRVCTRGREGAAGGLVGYVNPLNTTTNDTYIYNTTLTNLYVYADNYYARDPAYAGGVIGFGKYLKATMKNVVIGSKNQNDSVKIQLEWNNNPNCGGLISVSDLETTSAAGGLIGYTTSANDYSARLTNCQVLGALKDGESTTKISGYGRVGGLIGKAGRLRLIDCTVDGISAKGLNYTGGCVGELYYGTSNWQGLQVLNSDISFYGMLSDVANVAGGYVGFVSSNAGKINISPGNQTNLIENNFISGDIAGGALGCYNTASDGMSDISISKNKIISYSLKDKLVGGFAGKIETDKNVEPIEHVTIEENLIAGYEKKELGYGCVGGVLGLGYANLYFYDTKLKDNYIGFLLSDKVEENECYTKKIDTLREKLYLYSQNGPELITEIKGNDAYKYAYHAGALVARTYSGDYINHFINVNIQYSEGNENYQLASEVGLGSSAANSVTSYEALHEAYRDKFFIVYDAMSTEYPIADTSYAGFANVEKILADFRNEDIDRRYAYRLDYNYMSAESSEVDITKVYQHTYHDGTDYLSEFKTSDDQVIPMVVFRSSEVGTLDEVLQSYINMLTNNSGGINAYTGQEITVTSKPMKLEGGVIKENTDANAVATVQATELTEGSNQYYFANEAEDLRLYDIMTDEKNTTFTLLQIEYQYGDVTKWKLEIPVYVEQRLEYNTHIRFVEGLEYSVATLKNGKYTPTNTADQTAVDLDMGAGYSLYLEYIYGETRTLYENTSVPKTIVMDSANKIPFFAGTKLTLIDLESGGKVYYHTVSEAEMRDSQTCHIIEFSDFKDSAGNQYQPKDINTECTLMNTYEDVCGTEKNNVTVERYVLVVDTSSVEKEIRDERNNAYYELRTALPEFETNHRLYNKVDHAEHCTVKINETKGIDAKFDTTETSITTDSIISDNGMISFTMKYDIELDPVWLNTNKGVPRYLDIAIGLKENVGGGYRDISLPNGTQVFFETLCKDDAGNPIFVPAQTSYYVQNGGISDVYFYENCGIKNIMDMQAGTHTETVRVTLDFSEADLSSFAEAGNSGNYYISADLLVTMDAEKPEEGTIKDTFRSKVKLNVLSDIGIVLVPEDTMTLGINRYQPESDEGDVIPFQMKLVFPNEGYKNEELTSKYYTIIYQIEEKTERRNADTGAPVYTAYTGEQIKIYSGTKSLSDISSTDVSPITYETIKYDRFHPLKGNIESRDYTLVVSDGVDFSNYRITGYLVISDEDPGSMPEIDDETQSDFFVYTVAKVKIE